MILFFSRVGMGTTIPTNKNQKHIPIEYIKARYYALHNSITSFFFFIKIAHHVDFRGPKKEDCSSSCALSFFPPFLSCVPLLLSPKCLEIITHFDHTAMLALRKEYVKRALVEGFPCFKSFGSVKEGKERCMKEG